MFFGLHTLNFVHKKEVASIIVGGGRDCMLAVQSLVELYLGLTLFEMIACVPPASFVCKIQGTSRCWIVDALTAWRMRCIVSIVSMQPTVLRHTENNSSSRQKKTKRPTC